MQYLLAKIFILIFPVIRVIINTRKVSALGFSENLKKIRERKGLLAKELAALLGIPYTSYTAYENQGREAKYDTLVRIAEILDVSVDELLGKEEERTFYQRIKFMIESVGYDVSFTRDESDENITGVCIAYSGKYKGGSMDYNRVFSCQEFKEAFEKILNECEKEKENLLRQKIKLYLFDTAFGDLDSYE